MSATDGAAMIFSYLLTQLAGFKLMSVELHLDPGLSKDAQPTELLRRDRIN